MRIDDILCLYLIDLSEQVIVNFYKLACCFVELLRNCINQNAERILTGINPIESNVNKLDKFENAKELFEMMEKRINELFT